MCLIVVAHRMHPEYPLVVAANRDEDYHRPTASAAFWSDAPQVLAGRDLLGGGTWLGVTKQGRWAALTNVREPLRGTAVRSRGLLVSGFLRSQDGPQHYLARLARWGHRFTGFNLLAGDIHALASYSNRDVGVRVLSPGYYGLSNHLLDTPWPKVEQAKRSMYALLARRDFIPDQLWDVLADRQRPDVANLPETGIERNLEQALGAIFVQLPDYGTRCSTLLSVSREGHVRFSERRFDSQGKMQGESHFSFTLVR